VVYSPCACPKSQEENETLVSQDVGENATNNPPNSKPGPFCLGRPRVSVPAATGTDMTSFRAQMRAACVVEWQPSYVNYDYLMTRVDGLTSTRSASGSPRGSPGEALLEPRPPKARKAGRPPPAWAVAPTLSATSSVSWTRRWRR
jgi:hypothetical protein